MRNPLRREEKHRKALNFSLQVADRSQLPLVSELETQWSVCDLEDVVMGKKSRFEVLEPCALRDSKGVYGTWLGL